MYFNAETQANIVRRFHFALSHPGYLFLGKAEMLLNYSDRFQPVDLRKRLFRKASPTIMMEPGAPAGWREVAGREQVGDRLESAALASGPAVQLAIDLADKLRVANSAAGALFNLRPRDLGRPFQDLEMSYHPVELRSRIDQVRKELQSLNEELETTNEELQSTNEELQVINEELRGRTKELDQTNGFLGTVLRSLGSAVIVLTEDMSVRVWSPGAEDLWGLRPEEAESRDFLSLDIGLSAAEIVPWLRGVLAGATGHNTSTIALSALNRRGRTVKLEVAASPMRSEEGTVSGLILVIDQEAAE